MPITLRDYGRIKDSINHYRHTIELNPNHAKAHWNLSLALLSSGQFSEGWTEHRWRRKLANCDGAYPHNYDLPLWDGSQFQGKRLLVHYEQGFGDNIQFIRYLPMVKALGGTVILEVMKPLASLFYRSLAVDELIIASLERKPDVDFDMHVSVVDLPAIFGTEYEDYPRLRFHIFILIQARSNTGKRRISANEFNVGIVWGGSPSHKNDKRRSCELLSFKPLAKVFGCEIIRAAKRPAGDAGRICMVLKWDWSILETNSMILTILLQ